MGGLRKGSRVKNDANQSCDEKKTPRKTAPRKEKEEKISF